MTTTILGHENAVFDPLLVHCYVEPAEVEDKPILVGRWGAGKTAILLHKNMALSEELKRIDEKAERSWFIGESTFDMESLLQLQAQVSPDRESYVRALETLWRAEIVRTLSIVLHTLWKHYGSPKGDHWDYITAIGAAESTVLPVWRRVPDVLAIFLGTTGGRVEALKNVQGALDKVLHAKALVHLQACMTDIRNYTPQPTVAIEPIDTPTSGLEEGGMAQPVVTALLNLFQRTFLPTLGQSIRVHICVPWHRYSPKLLDYPQRFPEYVGHMKWNAETLRNFINSRLNWEFQRVGRGYAGRDAWGALFEDSIVNNQCEGTVRENTFHYYIRHTHYRPRDLQRLVRRTLVRQASTSGITVDQVLLGRKQQNITSRVIREVVRQSCIDYWKDEFLEELRRKFPNLDDIIYLLHGLPVPFTENDLRQRFDKIKDREPSQVEMIQLFETLWSGGIIGVEIAPKSEQHVRSLREILGAQAFRQYSAGTKKVHRWYFFEYNWHGPPLQLLRRYAESQEADAKLVLHPRSFETLLPDLTKVHPIGV